MAAVEKGVAVYVYGIDDGTVAAATITSISVKEEYSNIGEVKNQEGNIIEKRFDDRHKTGTVTLVYQDVGFTAAVLGTGTFAYDGETYWISDRSDSKTNNGYAEYTYSIRKTEFVSA